MRVPVRVNSWTALARGGRERLLRGAMPRMTVNFGPCSPRSRPVMDGTRRSDVQRTLDELSARAVVFGGTSRKAEIRASLRRSEGSG